MSFPNQLKSRHKALFQKRELDSDMNEEMRSHIEMRTQENIEAGMNPEEARFAALRQFGGTETGRAVIVKTTVPPETLYSGIRAQVASLDPGLIGALALTRILATMLFEINPADPTTFMVVPLVMAGVALLACWLPARRAAKLDPMEALRHE